MTRFTLLVVAMVTALPLAWADEPDWPYKLAERRAEEVRKQAKELEEERQVLRRDIEAAAAPWVKKANDQAAQRDGKVWTQEVELKRYVYFAPLPKPERVVGDPAERDVIVAQAIASPNLGDPPPSNAVLREWTDRFAIAQEFTYRWKFLEVHDIRRAEARELADVFFRADAVFDLIVMRRHAIAGTPKPIPQPPAGTRFWPGMHSSSLLGWGGGARELPSLPLPDGSTQPPAAGTLAEQAARGLQKVKPQQEHTLVTASVYYSAQFHRWGMTVALGSHWPQPADIPWSYGLSEDHNHISPKRFPAPTTQPAGK